MKNTGSELEKIVAALESQLMPDGFVIETNKKVFDENGVQEFEFDIVFSGPMGSGKYKCLIECRDRPSQGSAGREWIEQLFGRRRAENFNNVMAVSTTGFSPSAKELAIKFAIDLRQLDNLFSGAEAWFPIPSPVLARSYKARILGFRLDGVMVENEDQLKELHKLAESEETWEKPVFLLNGSLQSGLSIFEEIGKHDVPLPEGKSFSPGKSEKGEFLVDLTNPKTEAFVVLDSGSIRVKTLIYEVKVEMTEEEIPIKCVRQYSRCNGQVIAQRIEVPYEDKWQEFSLPFRVPEIPSDQRIALSFNHTIEGDLSVYTIFFNYERA